MPDEERPVGTPEEWLLRAKSNLARAKQPKPPEAIWEDLCFDAQQAAEKAIKALLVFRGIDFPKTHVIAKLLMLLDSHEEKVPEELWRADALTDYATEARYPGRTRPVTEEEYRQAVSMAEKVVQWAETSITSSQK